MKIFKNKKALIGILAALVIVLGIGFVVISRNSSATPTDEEEMIVVEKMAPEEIGLTITAKSDKKAVKFAIAKLNGIQSIDYVLSYEADATKQEVSEGAEERVQRGITGDATFKPGQSSYETKWLDLGSCSKNVCKYDAGVDSVMLTLKVVKDDGKVYEVEQTLEL